MYSISYLLCVDHKSQVTGGEAGRIEEFGWEDRMVHGSFGKSLGAGKVDHMRKYDTQLKTKSIVHLRFAMEGDVYSCTCYDMYLYLHGYRYITVYIYMCMYMCISMYILQCGRCCCHGSKISAVFTHHVATLSSASPRYEHLL